MIDYIYLYLYYSIMKKLFLLISLCFLWTILVGCGKKTANEVCPLTGNVCGISSWTIDHSDLSGVIKNVLLAIKNTDLLTISSFVWPQGLRFSPYEHVNIGTDVILTSGEVANGLAMNRSFTRWTYDGKWDPIDLWIGQYREKFVYDVDFATAPEIYHNQKFNRGNVINNIFDVYSGKEIIEYHFPQIDPQYEGMDWRSLYLVFEQMNGQWYLVWIVHGQWTI